MVVHVQTQYDNRNFSAEKNETFGNLVCPHIQIISNWQTITRKLNKNHDSRSLIHTVRDWKTQIFNEINKMLLFRNGAKWFEILLIVKIILF